VNSRIRILGVIAASARGGAEEAFAALLRGIDPQRFQVFVACDGTGPMYEEYRRFAEAVWPMNLSSIRHVSGIYRLARLIRAHRCQVVHTHLWNADVLGGLAARVAGVPSVSTVHGAYFLPISISGVRKVRRRAFSQIYRSIYRSFDHVVATSTYVADDLRSRVGIRAAAGSLEVVYNGIDLGRLDEMRASGALDPSPQWRGRPRIITPANFFPIKGHEWLIRAVPAVVEKFPAVEFMLAGDGESRAAMEQLTRELGVDANVTFAGSVANPVPLLLESDLFLLPSISEGLSIALLEALALGVPVVATTGGGTPEVIESGETGVLVPPASADALARAVIELLADRPRALRLAANGRQMVRHKFSRDEMVRRVESIYERLAS